jgi:hypothetical protein
MHAYFVVSSAETVDHEGVRKIYTTYIRIYICVYFKELNTALN